MEKNLEKYIREIAHLLNDEALFHMRDIPGDQDDFEDRSVIEPDQARHMIYVCINELMDMYDALDERSCSEQTKAAIVKVNKAVENLKMKM